MTHRTRRRGITEIASGLSQNAQAAASVVCIAGLLAVTYKAGDLTHQAKVFFRARRMKRKKAKAEKHKADLMRCSLSLSNR